MNLVIKRTCIKVNWKSKFVDMGLNNQTHLTVVCSNFYKGLYWYVLYFILVLLLRNARMSKNIIFLHFTKNKSIFHCRVLLK